MSGPYFETWEHENLVKFCKEAYEKLQRQEEALTAICVKCRSNEWGPTTPRKEILNWIHDHASAAIAKHGGQR